MYNHISYKDINYKPGYSNPDNNGLSTCFTTSAPAFLASCSVIEEHNLYTSIVYSLKKKNKKVLITNNILVFRIYFES